MSRLTGTGNEADLGPAIADETAQREAQWLRNAQTGDRTAYGQLVLACQDGLYVAVRRVAGDRAGARELTREAFQPGLMMLARLRGDASPYAWLFRIAITLAISQLRKAQRHRTFSLSAPGRNG